MTARRVRYLFFILFAVSGFSGLIYESIWSHYLKLFLGHAAYAQALVLSIFMGGMALGAWFAGQRAHHWTNLFIVYALTEGLIGLFGLGFHPLFKFILAISYDTVIPALGSPVSVHLYKWSVATLLILPQSILLGMTFPLMSNGIIRSFPTAPGNSLAMLYFTNSIGAAIGVIISGFLLIAAVGLPGTILFAALLNIFLAIFVYALAKGQSAPAIPTPVVSGAMQISLLMLGAAFITGTASFIYEIVWLRMLSMVLGASTHSFELMLSAFITGLAFGSLWIHRRIDRLKDPVMTAGSIQIMMGLLALSTLVLYNFTFDLMSFFMTALDQTEAGYHLFTFASHFIALLVMLPATFCAGMTLPLFTYILLQSGRGEKSIGQVYASNTLGAITGVAFAIFIGMPMLGLKGALLIGCILDIALGFLFLARGASFKRKPFIATVAMSILPIGAVLFWTDFDFRRMTSSVYRTEIAQTKGEKILFNKDGKTSSVHVIEQTDGKISISTNGKPDASIIMKDNEEISPDEPTMVLLAAIPLAIKPDAKTVANIGMGSGLTTHTLLAWPGIELVDTIEIEPAMVEGANNFRPRVERAYSDPRSHINIEDAKTYFSTHQKKYDIIISEPSNPWVSGVSSLFTDEFYHHIRDYLTEDGMFVQWLQTYEINTQLAFSVMRALMNNFSDFSLFAAHDGDIIIIAKNKHAIDPPKDIFFNSDEMRRELSFVKISNIQDITMRFIGNRQLIEPLIDIYNPAINSDYFPILDLNAPRTRFKQENALNLTRIRMEPIPLINMLVPDYEYSDITQVNSEYLFSVGTRAIQAKNLLGALKGEYTSGSENPDLGRFELLIKLAETCETINHSRLWIDELYQLTRATLPVLSPRELNEIWDAITPNCETGLDDDQNRWMKLVRALSNRDTEAIADNSLALLKQENQWDLSQRRFQFAALLLALVKLQDYPAAYKLWTQLSNTLYGNEEIPLGLLILYSLAAQQLGGDYNKLDVSIH